MHGQTIDDVNKNDPGRMKLTYQASTLEKFMVKQENENLEYNKIAIRSLVKRLRNGRKKIVLIFGLCMVSNSQTLIFLPINF